jgi:hypothetical protein
MVYNWLTGYRITCMNDYPAVTLELNETLYEFMSSNDIITTGESSEPSMAMSSHHSKTRIYQTHSHNREDIYSNLI